MQGLIHIYCYIFNFYRKMEPVDFTFGNTYEPVIRTRLTDVSGSLFTKKHIPQCQALEMKLRYCMEAYGQPLANQKCRDYKEDMRECVWKWKQV